MNIATIDTEYGGIPSFRIKYIQARLLARRLKVPFVKINSKTKSQKISGSKKSEKTIHERIESTDKEMEEKKI